MLNKLVTLDISKEFKYRIKKISKHCLIFLKIFTYYFDN